MINWIDKSWEIVWRCAMTNSRWWSLVGYSKHEEKLEYQEFDSCHRSVSNCQGNSCQGKHKYTRTYVGKRNYVSTIFKYCITLLDTVVRCLWDNKEELWCITVSKLHVSKFNKSKIFDMLSILVKSKNNALVMCKFIITIKLLCFNNPIFVHTQTVRLGRWYVCMLHRGSNCSPVRATDDRIMRCGIISSCQSASTSEIVSKSVSK